MPRARISPEPGGASSRWASGRRPTRIAMKTDVCRCRGTISMAESVASARRAVGGEEARPSDHPAGRYFTRGSTFRAKELDRGEVLHVEHLEQARVARPLLPTPSGSPPRRRGSPPGSSRRGQPSSSRGHLGEGRAGRRDGAGPRRTGSRPMASGTIRERFDRPPGHGAPPRSAWRGRLACGGRYRRSTRVQFHSSAKLGRDAQGALLPPRPPITSRSRPWVGRGVILRLVERVVGLLQRDRLADSEGRGYSGRPPPGDRAAPSWGGSAKPKHRVLVAAFQPPPIPQVPCRPLERVSSATAILASRAGW